MRCELSGCEQLVRGVGRSRLQLGLCRGQRPRTSTSRIRRELGGPLQERRRGRNPAARLRAVRRALELLGHGLVNARGRVRPMPGEPVGIGLGIGRLGERAVHLLAAL